MSRLSKRRQDADGQAEDAREALRSPELLPAREAEARTTRRSNLPRPSSSPSSKRLKSVASTEHSPGTRIATPRSKVQLAAGQFNPSPQPFDVATAPSCLLRPPPYATRRPLEPALLGSRAAETRSRIPVTYQLASCKPMGFATMFASSNSSNSQATTGPDLEEIQTEAIGFLALAGETKLRLFPNPWPSDRLPPPTSSLLSIASKKGLVAAAGPNSLALGSTDAVRGGFSKDEPAENNVKQFSPQLSIPVPRVTQVAFTSDENFLAISAEEGGGLAIYEVQSLMQGNTNPAHELATNGISVRALIPNPAEETAHILALVLTQGQLMLADLKERKFINGPTGPILREGVSCVAWSARGKQIVAGLGDGSSVQLKPDGSVAAEICRPPQLDANQHVSSIFWLANDNFLLIHTPTNFESDRPPESSFTFLTRQKNTSNYAFQKLQDPCPPFGLNRSPPHHFISRLRNFPPNLMDTLVVASSASPDIGVFTSTSVPLASDRDAAKITNNYTTTSMANETRRPQLPVNDEMTDTSPIGMAFDLSSKEPVRHPIPGEEIEATSTPLPALMVLNNEGVLSSWWFVYTESVKHGTAYPGLVAAERQARPQSAHQQSSFGGLGQVQSGTTPAFGKPSAPSFGTPSFGSTAAPGAVRSPWGTGVGTANVGPSVDGFGSLSRPAGGASGGTNGVFGTSNTNVGTPGEVKQSFGKPAFGSSTPIGGGGGFGAAGSVGNRPSPWGTAQSTGSNPPSVAPDKPSSPFGSSSSTSPFGALGGKNNNSSSASPFASFANNSSTAASSPFAAVAQPSSSDKSAFGAKTTAPSILTSQPSFGSTITIGSSLGVSSSFGTPSVGTAKSPWVMPGLSNASSGQPFGKPDFGTPNSPEAEMKSDADAGAADSAPTSDPSAQKSNDKSQGLFGLKASGFQVGSTLKGDGSAKDDVAKPDRTSFFGSAFTATLGETQISQPIPGEREVKSKGASQSADLEAKLSSPPGKVQPAPVDNAASDTAPHTPIKQEPVDDNATPSGLSTTPAASSDAAKLAAGDFAKPSQEPLSASKLTVPVPEAAPLPPDPLQQTKSNDDEAKTPKRPESSRASSFDSLGSSSVGPGDSEAEEEEAPLPPDFAATSTPARVLAQASAPTPSWSFPSLNQSTTPKSPSIAASKTPAGVQKSAASTLVDVTNPPTFFQRPGVGQESPRSPSPTRNQRPIRSPSPRRNQVASRTPSMTTPKQPQPSTTPVGPPPFKVTPRSVTQPNLPSSGRHSALSAVQEAQSDGESELSLDDDALRIQEELASAVQPSKRLESFLAHQDYVGSVGGQGIPAQIEKVYRDICSMVDTLGMNARSLKSWVKGQSELIPDEGRTRENLETSDSWCLIEIDDLGVIERELEERLEADALMNIGQILAELHGDQVDLDKQLSKHADIKRLVRDLSDPETAAARRAAPLTTEQSSVLSDLRKEYGAFQKLIADTESAVTVLKAKLASQAAANGGAQGSKRAVPTAEAVINTISKMTAMLERRSTDIDVLESRLRKLGLRPTSSHSARPTSGGSGSASFATPPASSRRNGSSAARVAYELDYSSDSGEEQGGYNSPGVLLSSSTKNKAAERGRLRAALSQEEIEVYEVKAARRKTVLETLRKRVVERGASVTTVER